jgi:hypothetical protein
MSGPLGDAQEKVKDLGNDVSGMSEEVKGKGETSTDTGGTTDPGMLVLFGRKSRWVDFVRRSE